MASQNVSVYVSNLPPGAIIMWWGLQSNLPSGWALCNGQNVVLPNGDIVSTPDLQDKFIVGAGGSFNLGDSGGASQVTLTENEMPMHNHCNDTFQVVTTSATCSVFPTVNGDATWGWTNMVMPPNRFDQTTQLLTTLPDDGDGQPFDILPPYLAVFFIIKIF